MNIEGTDELTVEDILQEANEASYHAVLEIWREVLKPAHVEQTRKITPQWANRITSTFREVNYADMPKFRDLYFGKVFQLERILLELIESDDECLNVITPEEDVQQNSKHYFKLLTDWQLLVLSWELAWDCTDPLAAVELAAISEVHRMFFGETGLTGLLDNIQFEVTDADRDALGAALIELQAASQEG